MTSPHTTDYSRDLLPFRRGQVVQMNNTPGVWRVEQPHPERPSNIYVTPVSTAAVLYAKRLKHGMLEMPKELVRRYNYGGTTQND